MKRFMILVFACAVALIGCFKLGDSFRGKEIRWVAVGEGGKILTSSDGTTWTWRFSTVSSDLRAVAHDGSLWVAVGDGGTIVTSPNGRTWWERRFPTVISRLSSDGITWMHRTSSDSSDLRGVAHDGFRWLAAGDGTILTSINGITWENRTSGAEGGDLRALAYTDFLWVAVGKSGTILTSPNRTMWTKKTFNVRSNLALNAVAHDGVRWVAVGDGGTIATSLNGKVWTAQWPSNVSEDLRAVAHDGFRWVAVGDGGSIVTSTHGRMWWKQRFSTVISRPSFDGTIRTRRTFVVSMNLRALAHDGSSWVAVGESGIILTSTDGRRWIRVQPDKLPYGFDKTLLGVASKN